MTMTRLLRAMTWIDRPRANPFHRALILAIFTLLVGVGCSEEAVPAGFRVTLYPTAVGHRGASTAVRVTLERDAGFTDDVEVFLADENEAIRGAMVFTGAILNGYLIVDVASDAKVEERSVGVLARSGAAMQLSAFELDVRAAEPFAQEKIEAARVAGEIDDGTALLYRAFASFGDPGLPEAYRGAGSLEEDITLLPNILEQMPTLPAAQQEALLPFTLRPNDPGSWHNAGLPTTKKHPRNAANAPKSCSELTSPGFAWVSQRSTRFAFRVWASCRGDATYDAESMQVLDRTMALLDKVWPLEGALMGDAKGNPLLDGGNDPVNVDDAIDVFLDRGPGVPRNGELYAVNPQFAAQSFPIPPAVGHASSGFLIIPERTFNDARFNTAVMHELFHVFQFAHNNYLRTPNGTSHWFVEASASWAAGYFERKAGLSPRGSYVATYARFGARFQPSPMSLNDPFDPHARSAFIWPYFVEHSGGGATKIGTIWENLKPANNVAEADTIIDAEYSFKDHFREFAIRNMNDPLLLPETNRHLHGDAEFKDDGVEPRYDINQKVTAELDEQEFPVSIKPLKASYLKLEFDAKRLQQVTFALPDDEGLDVDLFVKKQGKWEPKPRPLTGETELKFCEPIEEVRFVLSNYQRLPDEKIDTEIAITTKKAPCESAWHGTSIVEFSEGDWTFRLEATVDWILMPDYAGPAAEYYFPVGTITVSKTHPTCTFDYAPATFTIVKEPTNLLTITAEGDEFRAGGFGQTSWTGGTTETCPAADPMDPPVVDVTDMASIGGYWYIDVMGTLLSADGKTIKGTVDGNTFEFTKN